MIVISQLTIYPVKSMRGLALNHAQVTKKGFLFDRMFIVTEPSGQLVSSSDLANFTPTLIDDGITITAPDQKHITILYHELQSDRIASIAVNRWLSEYLQQDVQLRLVDHNVLPFSYPYLLISQQAKYPLLANIVVSSSKTQWKIIRVNNVIFDLIQHENNDAYYLVPRNYGIIHVGDKVEVLATHPMIETDETVTVHYGDRSFTANTQQVLLDQLEQQGIQIPYSCRSGICGQCALQLLEGEVIALRKGAIKRNKSILSCSCIPKTTIKLKAISLDADKKTN